MQLYLFSIVGNGVDVILIAAFAYEIAIVIIAAEESDKM